MIEVLKRIKKECKKYENCVRCKYADIRGICLIYGLLNGNPSEWKVDKFESALKKLEVKNGTGTADIRIP